MFPHKCFPACTGQDRAGRHSKLRNERSYVLAEHFSQVVDKRFGGSLAVMAAVGECQAFAHVVSKRMASTGLARLNRGGGGLEGFLLVHLRHIGADF